MIKRSVPVTFSVFCEDSNYAQGMKDGISKTLECLLHECDVIVRISPYVVQLTTEEPDNDKIHKYQVRARFTVREKRQGSERGVWIKQHVTNCYFDTLSYAKAIEARLKEKNNG